MKSLGPNHPEGDSRTYAEIAFFFSPFTPRECKMKKLCKLNATRSSSNNTCDCYSPIHCQIVQIERNRKYLEDDSNDTTEDP